MIFIPVLTPTGSVLDILSQNGQRPLDTLQQLGGATLPIPAISSNCGILNANALRVASPRTLIPEEVSVLHRHLQLYLNLVMDLRESRQSYQRSGFCVWYFHRRSQKGLYQASRGSQNLICATKREYHLSLHGRYGKSHRKLTAVTPSSPIATPTSS